MAQDFTDQTWNPMALICANRSIRTVPSYPGGIKSMAQTLPKRALDMNRLMRMMASLGRMSAHSPAQSPHPVLEGLFSDQSTLARLFHETGLRALSYSSYLNVTSRSPVTSVDASEEALQDRKAPIGTLLEQTNIPSIHVAHS